MWRGGTARPGARSERAWGRGRLWPWLCTTARWWAGGDPFVSSWSGGAAWTSLGGTNGIVYAFAMYTGVLIVGGSFTRVGGDVTRTSPSGAVACGGRSVLE